MTGQLWRSLGLLLLLPVCGWSQAFMVEIQSQSIAPAWNSGVMPGVVSLFAASANSRLVDGGSTGNSRQVFTVSQFSLESLPWSLLAVRSQNDPWGNFALEVYKNSDPVSNPQGFSWAVRETGISLLGDHLEITVPGAAPTHIQSPAGWTSSLRYEFESTVISWYFQGLDAGQPDELARAGALAGQAEPWRFAFESNLGSAFVDSPAALSLTGALYGVIDTGTGRFQGLEHFTTSATLIPEPKSCPWVTGGLLVIVGLSWRWHKRMLKP